MNRETYERIASKKNRYRLKLEGQSALFTRPDSRVDPTTYEVITPSAVRGVMDNLMGFRELTWNIDKIHVMNPIRTESYTVNGLNAYPNYAKAENFRHRTQQRTHNVLIDVSYIIDMHFTIDEEFFMKKSPHSGSVNDDYKYNGQIKRSLDGKRTRCCPHLGVRNMFATYEFQDVEEGEPDSISETRDLGWMLWGKDWENDKSPRFFHALMIDGVVSVPSKSKTFIPTEVSA